jgi:FkbM family methyltransferase
MLVYLLLKYFRTGLRGRYRLAKTINKFRDITAEDVETRYGPVNVDLTLSSGMALSYFKKSPEGDLIKEHASGVCYDIGAHFGIYSVLMSKTCEVFAFEPNSKIFHNLERTASRHGFTAFNTALSDFNGDADFFVPEEASMASLVQWTTSEKLNETHHHRIGVSTLAEIARTVTKTSCEAHTLDSFVNEHELPLPNFIKLDVEGSEIKVLRGGRNTIQKSRPTIFMEVSAGIWKEMGTSHEEGLDFFRSLGYRLFYHGKEVQSLDLEWDDVLAIPKELIDG